MTFLKGDKKPSSLINKWAIPATAIILTLAVAGKIFMYASSPATPAAPKQASEPAALFKANIQLPSSWKVIERNGVVTTWGSSETDDRVSVAAVEASATPLPSIVSGVRKQAILTDKRAEVTPLKELSIPRDVYPKNTAFEFAINAIGPQKQPVYIRQVWHRDIRSNMDIVATWTSADNSWLINPSTTLPSVDM